MCNYTTNVPECESTEYTSVGQATPDPIFEGGGPGTNLHLPRTQEGDACAHTLIPNQSNNGDDAENLQGFANRQMYYGGAGKFKAFFNTIKGVAFGEDPFIFDNPGQNVFSGVIPANSSSGPSVESGYPCSTVSEDECCYEETVFRAKYLSDTSESRAKNEYCNRMGLSPYRRRILRQHYPWAYQIFSYNRGLDWPFVNRINYFEQNNPEIQPSGKQLSGGAYSTPLRLQCLGFIQCEHHWGLGEAGACNNNYDEVVVPLSFIIPRRFIYACSAIPFFEFDLHEYAKDEDFDIDSVITNMRAFTAYFPNPTGNFSFYSPDAPYPDANNTAAV
jgi:hypothetical protein